MSIGMGFFMGSMFSELEGTGALPVPGAFISIIYLIMLGIMFFPILYLYRFASKMQIALNTDDQMVLAESFENIKSHYKFYGIFMAIMIGFYLLIFLFAGLFSAFI